MKYILSKVFIITASFLLLHSIAVPVYATTSKEMPNIKNKIELQSVESDFFTNVTRANVNRSVSGYLSGRYTSNYYEIELPSDGYISIDFEHEEFEEEENAWRITLFEYSENEIYRFSSRLNEEKVSSPNIGLARDKYYVRIDRPVTYTFSDKDYTLRVNHTESRHWEQEPNNAALEATPMSLNRFHGGSLHRFDDQDYFSFDLTADGYISIEFTHDRFDDNANGWRIILLNEDRVEVYSFSSAWNEPEIATANIGLERGKYFIKIDCPLIYSHNSNDYRVKVNYNQDNYREIEPNNDRSSATEITLNRPYRGSLHSSRDTDFYIFDMPNRDTVDIYFEHDTESVDRSGWRITLLDRDGVRVDSFSSRLNESRAQLREIELSEGKYYVRIDNPVTYAYSKADYGLTISSDQTSPDNSQDRDNDGQPEPIAGGKPGDINNDGRVNIQDAVLVIQSILGHESLTVDQRERADVDGNGRIDVNDANLIIQMTLGHISRFPVE